MEKSMQPRDLDLPDFKAVLLEVDRLHHKGYEPVGNWDLAQVLNHLAYFMQGALEGSQFKVPWIIKALFGKMVLRRILNSKRMKRGQFTPQRPLPPSGLDESEAVKSFHAMVNRFANHQGEYVPSAFFGKMSREECQELNRIHCNHHLGYLIPQGDSR